MGVNKIRKWRALSFVVLTVFIGVLIFILYPYFIDVAEKHTLYKDQKAQISFIGNWHDMLSNYEKQHKQIQEDIESMVVSLASEKEFSIVIEKILAYARMNIVNIHKIQPLGESLDEDYIKRSFRLEVQAGYNNTAAFINSLEGGDYLITTKKYSGEKKQSENMLTSFIDIEIILLKKTE